MLHERLCTCTKPPQAQHAEALQEMQRRQASYMRREAALRSQLRALEDGAALLHTQHGVSNACGSNSQAGPACTPGAFVNTAGGSALKPPPLRNLQQELQSGVEELLQRQRLQLRTEEASQLRLFRQQLTELDAQLSAGEKREAVQQGTTASELVSCGNGSKHTYPCMLISRIPWWHSASAADCVQKSITSFAPTTQRGFSA